MAITCKAQPYSSFTFSNLDLLSTTTLSVGEHLISLAVTDSDEMTTTDSIVVTVESSDTGI